MVAVSGLLVTVMAAVLVHTCCVVRKSYGQQLKSRDQSTYQLQSQHPEIFYDTRVIPDGAEVTSYLLNNETTRFFFPVDDDNSPLLIVMTPCMSPVKVKVVYQNIPRDGDDLNDDEGDDEDAEYNHFDYNGVGETTADGVTNRYNYVTLRYPETVVFSSNVSSHDNVTTAIYQSNSAAAGLYSIVATAVNGDTSVRLFATTSPNSDAVHPVLPVSVTDRLVRTVDLSPESFTLTWRPSRPATVEASAGRLEYCLSVSHVRHHHNLCSAIGQYYGDPEPTPPPHAGFGFAWERQREVARRQRQRSRQRQLRRQRMETSGRQGNAETDSKMLFFQCVGLNTSFTFRNAKPQRHYYVNVYAVDPVTNASRSYDDLDVTTPALPTVSTLNRSAKPTKASAKERAVTSSSDKMTRLVNGKQIHVTLSSKRPVKLFEYKPDRKPSLTPTSSSSSSSPATAAAAVVRNVTVYIRSCSADVVPITVVIERNVQQQQSVRSMSVSSSTTAAATPWTILSSTVVNGPFQAVSVPIYPEAVGSYRIRLENFVATTTPSAAAADRRSVPTTHWTLMVTETGRDVNANSVYPALPANYSIWRLPDVTTSVKTIGRTKSISSCQSVTLEWSLPVVAPTQRYCLYVQELTASSPSTMKTVEDRQSLNLCEDPSRKRSEKKRKQVSCKVVVDRSSDPATGTTMPSSRTTRTLAPRYATGNGVGGGGGDGGGGGSGKMAETVTGLKPGRQYAFDVFVIKEQTEKVGGSGRRTQTTFRAYNRLITSTADTC